MATQICEEIFIADETMSNFGKAFKNSLTAKEMLPVKQEFP